MNSQRKVLVTPLDWGLGHATQCIPLVKELLRHNSQVIIGADNRPYDLLRKEFPQLEIVRFPGYSVRYSDKTGMLLTMMKQLPSLVNGFRQEHDLLDRFIDKYHIDAVISHNRFGCYSKRIQSIFIIHQLQIKIPPPLQRIEKIVSFFNRMQCNKFDEVWIPDFADDINLAGTLSHPEKLPDNAYYIGPVTRLQKIQTEKTIDILVILSGPEPQRTIFEELLLSQLKNSPYVVVIARGKPEQNTTLKVSSNISMINTLHTDELSRFIGSARTIISRSGYSTIMDLSYVGAKAILIPTPNQPEQEYLAQRLLQNKICYSEPQSSFDLERALQRSKDYAGFEALNYDPTVLQQRINNLLRR